MRLRPCDRTRRETSRLILGVAAQGGRRAWLVLALTAVLLHGSVVIVTFAPPDLATPAVSRASAAETRRERSSGPRCTTGDPRALLPEALRNRPVISVIGSADPGKTAGGAEAIKVSRLIGGAIARAGAILSTGACPYVPQAAVEGAREAGGVVIGYSPYSRREDHVRAGSPVDGITIMKLLPRESRDRAKPPSSTALPPEPRYALRSHNLVADASAVIAIRGRSGTLYELAQAYDARLPIGVLLGTGGVTSEVKELEQAFTRDGKKNPITYGNGAKTKITDQKSADRFIQELLKSLEKRERIGISGPFRDG